MSADDAKKLSRRKLLEIAGGTAFLGGLYSLTFFQEERFAKLAKLRPPKKPSPTTPDIVAVEGDPKSYGDITERAINELGGIEQFVKKGDKVVISPNMGWMRTPDQAATTHPDVIRRLVQLCERAGASRITLIDYSLDDWKLAFKICGAEDAVKGTKATLLSPDQPTMYREVDISSAVPTHTTDGAEYDPLHHFDRILQRIPRDIIEADCFIVNPVVKDHEAAVITIAMKKLMGCIWNRKDYHRYGLHNCIAELNCFLRPTLVVTDATRVLQTRGPKGPGETTQPNTVVAGFDPVALDSYCTRFLTVKGVTPDMVPHLIIANSLGLGQIDTSQLNIREIAGAQGA
ncbi:MAG TPA: DUF362 domain-containing protein [Chthonomonas sp.]|jgi:uncharacterized protein (DUF362 family)|uniref:DUF362 domain-containing protein n=1 Tax=Chthonomonas sp. TaxID=2282153 RepID=UPI002B4AF3D4|nr:DUF362 domain-containing protein [Chthonomonas sp.]HLH81022.1 DUF362 domain-containing protein [Chthonomonas sp.]